MPLPRNSKSGISAITNVRMRKHSLVSPTANKRSYGLRDYKQRNARDESTHLRHQRSKQTSSGDCTNAPSALRGRSLPYGVRGLWTALHQPSHLARLLGQRHFPFTYKSQAKSSTDYPTLTGFCKKTMWSVILNSLFYITVTYVKVDYVIGK